MKLLVWKLDTIFSMKLLQWKQDAGYCGELEAGFAVKLLQHGQS